MNKEIVINGLRCLSDPSNEYPSCDTCPYDFASCVLDVTSDALQLIKEQEPRLVTPDDFKSSPNLDEHGRLLVWQEVRPGSGVKTFSTWMTITPEYMNDLHNVRFWTWKPTKEQIEAVKWDE